MHVQKSRTPISISVSADASVCRSTHSSRLFLVCETIKTSYVPPKLNSAIGRHWTSPSQQRGSDSNKPRPGSMTVHEDGDKTRWHDPDWEPWLCTVDGDTASWHGSGQGALWMLTKQDGMTQTGRHDCSVDGDTTRCQRPRCILGCHGVSQGSQHWDFIWRKEKEEVRNFWFGN